MASNDADEHDVPLYDDGDEGPEFDLVTTEQQVNSVVSGVATLRCSVLNLGDKTVGFQFYYNLANASKLIDIDI